MVGYVASYHGSDSPVVSFSLAVGLGMISNSVHISNPHYLAHALKQLRFELGSIILQHGSRDSVLEHQVF